MTDVHALITETNNNENKKDSHKGNDKQTLIYSHSKHSKRLYQYIKPIIATKHQI